MNFQRGNRFATGWVLGIFAAAIFGLAMPTWAVDKLPPSVKVVSLEAVPAKVELKPEFDYRQVLILGRTEAGETVDLTRLAAWPQTTQAALHAGEGLIRAKANGSEQLSIGFGDKSVKLDVTVSGLGQSHAVSFVRDVQPQLSKLGCTAGTCHGAANGKNGFKLSLRGYDPQADYLSITDELGARRFNRAAPEQSLMLLKAIGGIPHVGGVRTRTDDPAYKVLTAWIAQGVKLDLASPRVTKIDVYPRDPIMPLPEMKQQIVVQATYSDGSVRDVTREAFVESGDIELLDANSTGVVTALRRGEAPVLVRYEGSYAATTITVMGDRTGFAWTPPTTHNYVDQLVYKKLERVKIPPSELCSDEEFIRRVYLDLTGVPPTSDEVRSLLGDSRPTQQKRDELVDRLVGSREYIEHWTNKWADLLQVNRKFLGEEGSLALRNWIKQAIAENKPYDKFAYEILTAAGSTRQNPPAAYYKILRDPSAAMENSTQLFLAVRFNCNKCHDHPFERWTQDQYYHLASYFAQVGRKEDPGFAGQKIGGSDVEGAQPLVEMVFDTGGGDVTHQRTGQVSPPKFPFEDGPAPSATLGRREQMARWTTSKENRYFAKSYVNRLWGYLFGRGIIEPIDDIRAGNPATNPELLDALTKDFIDHQFDVQHIVKTICKSRTYQHSYRTLPLNADDQINYSHAIPRRLPAEVLYDTIFRSAGSSPRFSGVPVGFRAAQLPDAGVRDPFLDDFGRPPRESACECERSSGIVLGPVMKLINGPTVSEALGDGGNALSQLVAKEPDDAKVVEEVFLRFLARRPTAEETKLGLKTMRGAAEESGRLKAELDAYEKSMVARLPEWEKSLGASQVVEWKPLDPSALKTTGGATLTKQADGAIVVGGPNAKGVYSITATVDAKNITGLRLEALADPALPSGGPGRAMNGNFVISELRLSAAPKADPAKAQPVPLKNGTADFSQEGWAAAGAVDGNAATGWAVSPQFGKNHTATFETAADVGFDGGTVLVIELDQQYVDGQHQLGKFRLSYTTSKRPFVPSKLPDAVAGALATPAEKRSGEQQQVVLGYFRSQDARWVELSGAASASGQQAAGGRLLGVQDLAWALINSPSFLFNR